MHGAFLRSDYYGASAPPADLSRQRACPPSPDRMPRSEADRRRFPRSPCADRPGRRPATTRLLALLAEPDASGSTAPSRRCQGCFPSSPAFPGTDCPQLLPGRCDGPAAEVSHLHSVTVKVGPERGSGLSTGPFLRAASRTRRAPLSATGAPQVPWVRGLPHAVLGHGDGMRVPR
jgi:hypothetical protein